MILAALSPCPLVRSIGTGEGERLVALTAHQCGLKNYFLEQKLSKTKRILAKIVVENIKIFSRRRKPWLRLLSLYLYILIYTGL